MTQKAAREFNQQGLALSATNPAHAETAFRDALARDPTFAEAHRNLGGLLARWGRHDEAIVCYRQALQFDPGDPVTHEFLASALEFLGRKREAAEAWRELARVQPDHAEAFQALGFILQNLGQLEEAAASKRRFAQLAPRAGAWADLGALLFRLDRFADAVLAFREAEALERSYFDSHAYESDLYRRSREATNAR